MADMAWPVAFVHVGGWLAVAAVAWAVAWCIVRIADAIERGGKADG